MSLFPKLNILVAYPYMSAGMERLLADHKDDVCLMVDSGAFTVHKAGATITLDEYCAFIRALPVEPWRYITLDVIGNTDKTLSNYNVMRERGFTPLPVLTRGQPISDIEGYYATSDLVCVGGFGDSPGRRVKAGRVQQIMEVAKGRKVHLLGYTNLLALRHFKPYSCDSSTWLAGQKFGTLCLYYGNGIIQKRTYAQMQRGEMTEKDFDVARSFGYDLHDMKKLDNRIGGPAKSKMSALSIASWVACSIEYERVLGMKLFLAISSDKYVFDLMLTQYRLQKERWEARHAAVEA